MNELEFTKLFEKAYKAKTDNNNYWNQIFELRKFVTANMISKCFSLINSDNLKSKQIGIDILSQLGKDRKGFAPKMINEIFEIFETSTDEKLISKSLFAIGHNNKYIRKKHLDVLEKFKTSNSTDIRYALTFSLLGIKRKAAIKILIELAHDKSLRIRDWATFGLGTQIETDTKEIRDILYKNSLSKNDQIRQEAIKGLANRNDERVEKLILSELYKENFGTLFFDTLLNIKNGEQYLPLIINIYEKYKHDKDINATWLSDLKNCIKVLQEI
ncbi:hypothetical protein [Chryseobacterium terrae]|uniref:HEAT repeat-containing protein n=1 Tax=Chryseobacterium terrae TaxID=3163299 RepID=A0ABW8Y3I0_9FLAO